MTTGGGPGAEGSARPDETEILFDEFASVATTSALALPGDPLFANQWHLNAINVLAAWNDYTGAGVSVAVYDQGIDRLHVDLDGNFSTAASVNASNLRIRRQPGRFQRQPWDRGRRNHRRRA